MTFTHADLLADVLSSQAVASVYQPVVRLDTRAVVGYEALARGPEGTALESPANLLEAARNAGLLAEMDWACRGAAVRAALDHGLGPPFTLFVNIEPEALGAPVPDALREAWIEARGKLRVVFEITERALTARPAELLHTIARVRELGWGVAVDDVGADPNSLALMPLLKPDVIKLDSRLIQGRPTRDIAAISSAVAAQQEQTGATVVAGAHELRVEGALWRAHATPLRRHGRADGPRGRPGSRAGSGARARVRGTAIEDEDPALRDWTVVVVGRGGRLPAGTPSRGRRISTGCSPTSSPTTASSCWRRHGF